MGGFGSSAFGGRGGAHRRMHEEFWAGASWGRPMRLRRGDIRQVLLVALLDGAAHGYELIRRLEERSGGLWRPSAGSVYPTLQQMEDEGLVTSTTEGQEGGKRVYELTEAGREAAGRATDLPWGRPGQSGPQAEVREAVGAIGAAARQVVAVGSPEQVARAVELLTEACQKLYQLLAEG